jgi:Domain of unknown function (DUF4365)
VLPGLLVAHAEETLMEHYSFAYLKALAAARGYVVKPESPPDNDSIDAYIVGHGPVKGKGYSPRLGVQLKCTARLHPKDGALAYPLPIKNYDDLRRTETNAARVLVVVCVPDGWQARVQWTPEELRLARCAYWQSLTGLPETTNKKTVNVALSKLLNLETIDELMFLVASEALQ